MKMKDIIIKEGFRFNPPRIEKLQSKFDYLVRHGEYQSPIVLDKDNVLIDGYTTYILAHFCDIKPLVTKYRDDTKTVDQFYIDF